MTEPQTRPTMLATKPIGPKTRIRIGLVFTFFGLFVFVLGADPALFGLDRSPVTGFVQIAVFLVGLGFISAGGYLALRAFWNGEETTIRSDVGARLIATGYVVAAASGMADVFGFGSEAFPRVPEFGVWQQRGVLAGEVLIGVGLLLLIRWRKRLTSEGEKSSVA